MVAVISGGLGDIGYAIATELASAGHDVALADLVVEDAGRLDALSGHGGRASYAQVDTTDAEAVEQWLDTLPTPTVVVPAAARVSSVGPLELTPAQWRAELDVDLTGPYLLASAAARRMVAAGSGGAIVFVGSWAADRPHPGILGYGVAKAGVRMLMKCLALELAEHRIRVNEVAPGYVDAGLSAQLWRSEPGRRAAAVAEVPLGELCSAWDIGRLVAFLTSPAASTITGSTVLADGGLSLRR